jgi:hypothetical protein
MSRHVWPEIDDVLMGDAESPRSVALRALRAMSICFETRDLEALLESFSAQPSATYAGSELGEVATGRPAIRRLLSSLFHRPAHYSFSFPTVSVHRLGECVWVLADGTGRETTPDEVTPFPYRVCGVLTYEHRQWRWAVLTGAEPTPPVDAD